jgi:hypothetical protein
MALASAADRHRGVAVFGSTSPVSLQDTHGFVRSRFGEGWVESLGVGSVGRGRVVIWGVGLARCYVTFEMYFVTVEWGEG